MYRYSMTQWIAGNQPIQKTLEQLKACGYDGVEFGAEPDQDLHALKATMEEHGLMCTSLCGMYTPQRDLASSDPKTRKCAQKYLRDSIDMAALLGAKLLIVVPSPVGKIAPDNTYEEAWDNALISIQAVADYAQQKGILLAMEAINRYETFLVPNLTLMKKFVEQVGHPSVKLMADLFHMALEERSIEESLRMVAPHLVHIHIADNTREPAGFGLTDFKAAFRVLKEIGYDGAITMEFLPPVANPYLAIQMGSQDGSMELYMRQSLDYIRCVAQTLDRAR